MLPASAVQYLNNIIEQEGRENTPADHKRGMRTKTISFSYTPRSKMLLNNLTDLRLPWGRFSVHLGARVESPENQSNR